MKISHTPLGANDAKPDHTPPLPHTHTSAPSCDHFGRHGDWKKYLATKILAKVANWRPTD